MGGSRSGFAKGDDDVEISDDDDEKKKKKKPAETEDDDDGDPDKPKAKQGGDSSRLSGKQDLTGHDLPTSRKTNVFEQDRFFVDKVDTKKTRKDTLVQGSLTGTTFAYMESGGNIAPTTAAVPSASNFSRLFLDMRLQTDFRHISGSRWDARVDVRGRVTVDPDPNTNGYVPPNDNSKIQSGFNGGNELEIKELWIIRNGHRSDVFFGRQFVPDLAGVKFDGLRIDYASSEKFTLLTFGGLYPLRGSRSITTDYTPLRGDPLMGDTGGGPNQRENLGRFTGTAGGGAAYRTQNMYGAFGGVVIAPLTSEEQPRLFGTSTGYWRTGPKIDFYHFAVVDLLGSNIGITNLSAGLNFKPDQRLRATASVNRVDTETLNLQAQAFLNNPDTGLNVIQNEQFLARIAQNQVRGSLSAGLGQMQRFEATTALTFRYRDGFTLTSPSTTAGETPVTAVIPAGKSVEVYGSLTDRRSYKNARIGADFSRIFRVGDANYQRTSALTLRGFASRELKNGHGEWEGEVAYTTTKDDDAGKACVGNVLGCFGAAQAAIIQIGGSLYYRVNRDWFAMGGLYINHQSITHVDMMMSSTDPGATGLSGFFRFSRRF